MTGLSGRAKPEIMSQKSYRIKVPSADVKTVPHQEEGRWQGKSGRAAVGTEVGCLASVDAHSGT